MKSRKEYKKEEWLSLRISEYEKDMLQNMADREHRSLSEMARELIRRAEAETLRIIDA